MINIRLLTKIPDLHMLISIISGNNQSIVIVWFITSLTYIK
ncbi:hypothetical protein NARC_60112 [Candidatus Nitrosocosmicus arcticus]|uniref:Uncharacterized protein n=1 Tax=Candidatus Nitrosocosmicus arcticus TaxID=2035267 RepID=A0A557SVU3_9ARCH|nr:hypothetical protein NARC_60112 [Candidatus Nitrosocosmicus arcticus]